LAPDRILGKLRRIRFRRLVKNLRIGGLFLRDANLSQGWRAIFHWYSLVTSDNLIITLLTEGKMYEKHCTMARVAARGVA